MAVWRQLAGNFPRIAVMLHDLVMVWACWQLLHIARYAILEGAPAIQPLSFDIAIVMLLQAMAFHYVGLYRGLWRFASVTDLVNIFKACFIGVGAIVLVF
ncbi:MAG: polysaccharide biosynthesis protein, partial [Stenotrophomonas nitritireducens]|nr:polysaccharide biosynthesis protein [Stenotrophomonas nitritireducens]